MDSVEFSTDGGSSFDSETIPRLPAESSHNCVAAIDDENLVVLGGTGDVGYLRNLISHIPFALEIFNFMSCSYEDSKNTYG